MSKKTTYLLGILLTIIIGTILYWWLCCGCCKSDTCEHNTEKETVVVDDEIKETSLNPFSISDDGFNIKENDNFNFKASDFSVIVPLSDNLKNSVSQLKTYLDENPAKQVNITGYFTSDEVNNSAYPNLGLARANAVKNNFSDAGISSKLINTFGELNEGLVADENSIHYGPVNYSIQTIEEGDNSEAENIKALGDLIRSEPLVLYFNTGEKNIQLSEAQRQKVANIVTYLDKVDGATCSVVGHTDNTGDAEMNMTLGQERADFAKSYLVNNAIPASKIIATSQGPNEPIADNNTEEGKAKNRRTVVTIN